MGRDTRKGVFMVNANSKDPVQPMEIHSLIRNFAIVGYVLQHPKILHADSECPDQIA